MATSAAIGYGAKLSWYNGTAYVDLAEITSLKSPSYSRDTIDATHMQSPNLFREFIPGLMEAGEVSIDVNYIPAVSDTFIALMVAGVANFRITHPNGVKCTFDGILTGYERQEPLDDKMSASITVKVTGKPVLS